MHKTTRDFALYSSDFKSAHISVDGQSALFFFEEADAEALKLCVDHLKSESDSARLNFYRDMLGDRPLCGSDGILMQLVNQ